MNKEGIFLKLTGALLCFIMFGVGMLYAEQEPILILLGIVGLGGFSYFVSTIVFGGIVKQK